MGATARVFRAGLATPSITLNFRNDHASGSVEATLRPLITSGTSGAITIIVKKVNSATTTVNPSYTMTGIIDGDLTVLNETVGEIGEIGVKFVPYSGSLTVSTTAT